jgi:hypothetical protein
VALCLVAGLDERVVIAGGGISAGGLGGKGIDVDNDTVFVIEFGLGSIPGSFTGRSAPVTRMFGHVLFLING